MIELEHFGPALLVASLALIAHAGTQCLQQRRLSNEAKRLRFALQVQLEGLVHFYQSNVDRAPISDLMISGRNQINLLRTHISRITLLEESEIRVVLAAVIAVEQAEAAISLVGKSIANSKVRMSARAEESIRQSVSVACTNLKGAASALDVRNARKRRWPIRKKHEFEPLDYKSLVRDLDESAAHESLEAA